MRKHPHPAKVYKFSCTHRCSPSYSDSGSVFAAPPNAEGGCEVQEKDTLQAITHGGAQQAHARAQGWDLCDQRARLLLANVSTRQFRYRRVRKNNFEKPIIHDQKYF